MRQGLFLACAREQVRTSARRNAGDVQIWTVPLDVDARQGAQLERTLSADERQRAERFVFARDRARFIIARGALRTILGRELRVDPAAVRFSTGVHGKPRLADGTNPDQLQFNLAHSGDLAIIAIVRGCAVGIDVEQIRPDHADRSVAAQFFATAERGALRAYRGVRWPAAFFACWTRKEAFVKALGDGLTVPLHSFEVSVDPTQREVTLRVQDDEVRSARWSLRAIDVPSGYAAALAVEGAIGRVDHTTFCMASDVRRTMASAPLSLSLSPSPSPSP
jgi:4'-phosphopantetheinyl transferase